MSDPDKSVWLYVLDEDIAVQRILIECVARYQQSTKEIYTNTQVRGFREATHFWQRFNPQEPSAVILGRFETTHVRWDVRGQLVRQFPCVPLVYLSTSGLEEAQSNCLTWEWPVPHDCLLFLLGELLIQVKRQWKYSQIEMARQVKLSQLTPREREILSRLLLGRPMSVTAQELGIDEKTAWGHRGRAMAKLGLSRNPNWAQWILEAGGLPKIR